MTKSRVKVKNIEEAIDKVDCETIIDLASQHRSKKEPYSFYEYLEKKNESQITKLTDNLHKILQDYITKHLVQNGTIDWASSDPESCKKVGQLIQAVAEIALACIQCKFILPSHLKLAVLLNGIMLPMPSTMEATRNIIAQYCEKLFLTNVFNDGCEYFLYNVVIYLLRKTLSRRALKTDVKRLCAIRKIIRAVAEMKEVSKTELWELFKGCALSQTYLSIKEGLKLITLSFTLDADKVEEMHLVIKNVVDYINIKTAEAYGKIYFDAWYYSIKTKNSRLKDVLEITCIQDFILTGLKAEQKPTLALIRKILSLFPFHKKEQEVCSMLYSLYQPLIWRFLKNPNGQIRANAAQMFLDIFPLEDPDVRIVETDIEVNEQLIMIKELLTDDFPIVRITTTLGICLSMSVNWEVFPEEMLKSFFRILINDLCRDSASSEVRISVVKGIKCLLENPLSLKCLVAVLPKLTGLFHDIHENVRIAFCQLLLRVKTISAIKYFQIVPTHHLFARLEEDCHAVKKSISNLLHNSYFPRQEDPKVWLGRCLEIIRTERNATRVFFSYASCFIGMDGSVRFMVQAAKAVHFYVKTKSSSENLDRETSNKENVANLDDYIDSLEEAVGFSNLNIVSTVMDAITVMWLSLKMESEKDQDKTFLKMLVHRIGPALSDLCLHYKETVAWESVFYVSSFLPRSMIPSLGSLLFWRLKNLPPDAEENEYWTLIECLYNQQQGFELLTLLKEWIGVGLADSYVPPSTKKRRKTRKSSESIYYDQPKPYLANRMLNSILNHRSSQKSSLSYPQVLRQMLCFFNSIKRKLERFNARVINEVEAEFLNLLMINITRLSVLLYDDEEEEGDVQFVNEVVKWTQEKLIKHLDVSDYTTDNFTELVFKICENLCGIVADVIALGYCDRDSTMYLEFFEKLLCTGLASEFLVITSRFLYKHAATGQFIYLLENDRVMISCLLGYLPKMLTYWNNETFILSIPQKKLDDTLFGLANVMQIEHNYLRKLPEQAVEVFKSVIKYILDSAIVKTSEIVEEMAEDPFDRLSFPKVGTFFMSVANNKAKIVPTYVKLLTEMFQSSEINISMWIAYWMMIFEFITKSTNPFIILETEIIVPLLETSLHEIYPRENYTDSMNTSTSEHTDSVSMQLFQRHCHGELIKLKKRQASKMKAARAVLCKK